MATRKKASRKRKKASRRRARKRAAGPLRRRATELAPTLPQFSRDVRKRLRALERQVESAGAEARRRAARLLRQLSTELGRHEGRGEAAWSRLPAGTRDSLRTLLRRVERAVAPARRKAAPRRKRARRSTAAR